MRFPSSLLLSFAFLLSLAATGCGTDPTCNDACVKVRSCSLSASNLSCSNSKTTCVSMDKGCAPCLVDKSCNDIRGGACATACPGYQP